MSIEIVCNSLTSLKVFIVNSYIAINTYTLLII